MANKPTLEIPLKRAVNIKLLFDEPKIGHTSNGEWRLYGVLHDGVEKSYFASDKAHEMLQHYSKGDWVNIEHKLQADGKRTVYEVTPGKEERKSVENSDKDLAIKWGMAFNNATKLVSSMHNENIDLKGWVKAIDSIMPEMYRIACSMPQQEKVVEEKVIEEKVVVQEEQVLKDDIPF
mgnify:FL=1